MQDMATFHHHYNPASAPSPPSPVSAAKSQEMRSKLPAAIKNQELQVKNGKENDVEFASVKNEAIENEKTKNEKETKYVCPICKTALSNQHDFTLHIRSHNNDSELANVNSSKGFTCRICGKVLGSASSLDRHVLVHSGERPFRCHVCGLLFKTNGNMHRHIRTAHYVHKNTDPNTCNESDSSTDSNSENQKSSFSSSRKRKLTSASAEFNNNSIDLPLKFDRLRDTSSSNNVDFNRRGRNEVESEPSQWFICPVCDREDFSTLHVLESHIEENHPEYKIKCNLCNLEFSNHKKLNLHRSMKHHDTEQKGTEKGMIGFKDLTFTDFSSGKFPYIAKTVCEKQVHRSNSSFLNFQCEKCQRGFPCAEALSIHQHTCLAHNYPSSVDSYNDLGDVSSSENEAPTDLSSSKKFKAWKQTTPVTDEERKRESFFAGLDLQNRSISSSPNSPMKLFKKVHGLNGMPAIESKDLADIQSIINVTSANFMTDLSKSPQPSSLEVTPPDSGSRNYDLNGEEEQQDCFAAEFRKMKLQGKFPCRLCSSVFTNLRALKGHNRIHLTNSPSNGIYRCNMCPHSNTDKAALIRHMRTHNGERPYQCSICRYAFTTKANCERHLKNRHGKMSREEVKNSIIYHPSEDSTNNISDIKQCSREDVKRLLFAEVASNCSKSDKETDGGINEKSELSVEICKESPDRSAMTPPSSLHSDDLKRPSSEIDAEENVLRNNSVVMSAMTSDEEDDEEEEDENEHDESFKSNGSGDFHYETSHAPLDLSMDVLDLSKKKSDLNSSDSKASENSESNANLKQTDEADEEADDEELDDEDEDMQSMPQDLSKKSGEPQTEQVMSNISDQPTNHVESSNDCKTSVSEESHPAPQSPDAFSKAAPKTSLLTNLYANNMNLNSHSPFIGSNPSFPAFPAAGFPPYFLPPSPFIFSPATPELAAAKDRWQKEFMRGLQLSGGSLMFDQMSVVPSADRFQALQQQALAEFNRHLETQSESLSKPFSPLGKSPDQIVNLATNAVDQISNFIHAEKQSAEKLQITKSLKNDASSSIKMVIKNGILIPKQKQRRYRTERPFTCEHCSARFTLRSNMERHIKQQHPQFWSQRQRGASGTRGRGGYSKASLYDQHSGLIIPFPPNFAQSNSVNSFTSSTEENESFQKQSSENSKQSADPTPVNYQSNKPFVGISDEVKFAISQQLKTKFQTQNEKDNEESDDREELKEDEDEMEELIIDEEEDEKLEAKSEVKPEASEEEHKSVAPVKKDENVDLVSVSRLLDNASTQTFKQFFKAEDENAGGEASEEDEEGLVGGSTSEGNISGSDENKSEPESSSTGQVKKKSAYSLAPNRVSCPYCSRKFPWTSSLRRHVLTHTGQKPYKCPQCPLLFTTKSNCDRHLQRKHSGQVVNVESNPADPCSKSNSCLNFTTRNVPERPYKCKNCPSSTFSTVDNLKKHITGKHNGKACEGVGENDSKLDNSVQSDCENEHGRNLDGHFSGYESHGSGSEEIDVVKDSPDRTEKSNNENDNDYVPVSYPTILQLTLDPSSTASNTDQVSSTPGSTDLAFKCHLCDGSYAERNEALDHIRNRHASEFQLLVSKGALDVNGTVNEENANIEENSTHGEENLEQLRGKFPDYANRKVKCAFCLRRFWSAEDLRRHMRTHTGERPFSCDICRRRFTLKHSMLRHRKKHSLGNNFAHNSVNDDQLVHSDDDNTLLNAKLSLPIINHNNNNINTPFKSVFSSPLKFWKAFSTQNNQKNLRSDSCDEGNDLIGNLLGIHDKAIIDKMLLSKSPDDVAKILGVQK